MRQRSSFALLLVAVLAIASCYTYRAEPAPTVGASRVRVRFHPPRPVDVAAPGRDTVRLEGVTELEGRVVAVRGDSLHLALESARTASGQAPGLGIARATTVIQLGAGRVVEVRRLDGPRTALAGLAVAGAGLGVLLLVAIATLLSFPS